MFSESASQRADGLWMLNTYRLNSHFLLSNKHQDAQSRKAMLVNTIPVQQVTNALLPGLQRSLPR